MIYKFLFKFYFFSYVHKDVKVRIKSSSQMIRDELLTVFMSSLLGWIFRDYDQ